MLRNGCKIPAVGSELAECCHRLLCILLSLSSVGTFKLKNERVLKEVLDTGLKCGYRLIGIANKLQAIVKYIKLS